MPPRKPKPTDRVTVSSYRNAKGEDKVAIQITRKRANRIAVGDWDALQDIIDSITKKVERDEARDAENT